MPIVVEGDFHPANLVAKDAEYRLHARLRPRTVGDGKPAPVSDHPFPLGPDSGTVFEQVARGVYLPAEIKGRGKGVFRAYLWPKEELQTIVLEEITVTAQKRDENIQEIPISITAMTGEQVDSYNFV